MLKGVHLSLMIGPAVPVPVGSDVLEALTSVEVTTRSEGPSAFQLRFKLGNSSPLHTPFTLSAPLVRVILTATVGGSSEVLIDGVMTNHEISRSDDPAFADLTLTGEDLSRVMDYIDFSGMPYPAMPPEARVALIVAKYAFLGIIPKIIPSVLIDIPVPTDRIPRQKGKDLAYVKALADQVGYVFYVEPGATPGTSFAYWGPEIRVGAPQPALNVDMDAHTNVESMSFNYDSEKKTLPYMMIHNAATKVPIPIPLPDITPLSPPLGAVPPIPKKVEPITETAKFSPVKAAIIGIAKAARSADVATARGSLDVLRYGRTLKARRLVSVRGAGAAFNGLYYVKSVTHSISRGRYTQSFELARNGLISTIQKVPA